MLKHTLLITLLITVSTIGAYRISDDDPRRSETPQETENRERSEGLEQIQRDLDNYRQEFKEDYGVDLHSSKDKDGN